MPKSAYEIARRPGGKYHGWYLQQLKLTNAQLERAIRSFECLAEQHRQWIADPRSKIPNFDSLHPSQQRDLVERHWRQDIQRHRDSIDILRNILKERSNAKS